MTESAPRLVRSTAVVGQMTLFSRVLGFIRDMVIARMFGATAAADVFFVAFKIPNLFRRLFAEGAFAQAFVPVLAEYRTNREHGEVRELVGAASAALGLVVIAVSALGVVSAPVFIMVFAPGFLDEADKLSLATTLLRLTFPYLALVSLTALAGGVLNTYGRFAVPAFTPALLNVAIIGAALWLAPQLQQPVIALAIGVIIGGVAQLALQLPFLARLGLLTLPRLRRAHPGVSRIKTLMIPAMFGVSVAQLNLMLDTIIASFLVTGSISWLYYSDRLLEFPLGVFGIALGTVILPALSRQHAAGDGQHFSATLDWGLRWVVIIGVPAALGLFLLSGPMLSTLFQYEQMTPHDVAKASLSLNAYSLGLVAFILIKILAPGYYSRQDTRTPVRIGIIAMLSNMVLNIILVFPLAHAGLALATSLSAYLNAGLLGRGLLRDGVYRPAAGWPVFLARAAAANVVMCVLLIWWVPDTALWSGWHWSQRATTLAGAIFMGAGVYALTLAALGMRTRHLRAPGPV
ncbi:MAG: murein biosynthesis integral membrane protein MurJ [Gammaproteobacteria bacterium]|nr:murein biosynthesis integral membrane protein MurJ [Gammaproteobacteria bacterium]